MYAPSMGLLLQKRYKLENIGNLYKNYVGHHVFFTDVPILGIETIFS